MAVYHLCNATWAKVGQVIETRPVVETTVYHEAPRIRITHCVPQTRCCTCISDGDEYLIYKHRKCGTNIYL
ncbi:hypothetical protein BBBOND_0300610 [Babesia bigemina]|uniref:Uncharacterized protein n=1 Tax=Babesia bigemina TaxID=5866 RepID=A0A061D624_BABBI|nr:hypothetical protein BBBOND_0300610 [Babesia bigemina]CDR96156.1 hypothetical protein BBBOND_0300610 [Babesia bigemina]|eukprot:XP_012768342.1 hypothetical protein BBBOND_0300610 [Babesia bigemina]